MENETKYLIKVDDKFVTDYRGYSYTAGKRINATRRSIKEAEHIANQITGAYVVPV